MKKTRAIVAALLVVAVMLGSLAGCSNNEQHTHEYTKYGFNANQHWKYCEADQEIDESSRTAHNYGENGVCECGKNKPSEPTGGNQGGQTGEQGGQTGEQSGNQHVASLTEQALYIINGSRTSVGEEITELSRVNSKLFLLPDGIAKYLPSSSAESNQVSGTWALEGTTLKLTLNKLTDAAIDTDPSAKESYEITPDADGVYRIVHIGFARDVVENLEQFTFIGKLEGAENADPNQGGEQGEQSGEQGEQPGEQGIPQDAWETSAEYAFPTRRGGLFLLPEGVAKYLASAEDGTVYTGTWSKEGNAITVTLNAYSDGILEDAEAVLMEGTEKTDTKTATVEDITAEGAAIVLEYYRFNRDAWKVQTDTCTYAPKAE